jgi:hypothetical protein
MLHSGQNHQYGGGVNSKDTGTEARRIPRWAASLIERLTQDRPAVISRDEIASYLADLNDTRDAEDTIRQLVRLDWLSSTSSKGVWAFVPLGEQSSDDPYLPLRAWRAKSPEAVFTLAGEAAAWHLGYLDRRFTGPTRVWIPEGDRLPFGSRKALSVVHLGWAAEIAGSVSPSRTLLRRRGLDLTRWASGLPSFGPEALLSQLAIRPSSFVPWADLTDHLQEVVEDCDANVLTDLLASQPSTAWQRAAYLANAGGQGELAGCLLEGRQGGALPHIFLGTDGVGIYSAKFNVTDRLVAPRLLLGGKA